MNVDEERYKLCLQCCEEYLLRPLYKITREFYEGVVKSIRDDLRNSNCLWKNEVYCYAQASDTCNLCSDCPYELEHFILAERLLKSRMDTELWCL